MKNKNVQEKLTTHEEQWKISRGTFTEFFPACFTADMQFIEIYMPTYI